ncbi:MAG: diheme cytochrome c-553 [Deltaproteobacteria bacterium]|nr:diheme cytochrome c-553 [Deltaproteobacteria bacterium]
MRESTPVFIALAAVLSMFLPAIAAASGDGGKRPGKTNPSAQVAHGKYLATVSGCHDCHSPKRFTDKGPVVDENRVLSGHPAEDKVPPVPKDLIAPGKWGGLFTGMLTAWAGPWGVSFSSNLTPDRETGIGGWTEAAFIKSIRTGRTPGGRPLLPPMPWQFIGRMTDRDLKAIYAYLKSIPPIRNMVPDPIPPK